MNWNHQIYAGNFSNVINLDEMKFLGGFIFCDKLLRYIRRENYAQTETPKKCLTTGLFMTE